MRPVEHASALLRAAASALRGRPAPRPVRRILVLGYGAIGDTVFFLPVVEVLRAAHPCAALIWLSNPSPVSDELIPASGLADEVWRWEAARGEDPRGRAEINARIAAAGFDLAVLAPGAPAQDFVAALSRVPLVAGHRRPGLGTRRFLLMGEYARRLLVNRPAAAPAGEHALARSLRLLDALGLPRPSGDARPRLPVPPEAERRADELLAPLEGKPFVVVHLGPLGNQYGKMWAPENFAALSRLLSEAWRIPLVLVGSGAEAGAEARARAAGGAFALSLVGRTSLAETFAVLRRASLLIGNDAGPAKAAAALGVPTATFWGPSDPAEFRSPWDPERHLDLRSGIACSPCTRLGVPSRSFNYLNCGHRDCLGRFEPERAARLILERWPRLSKG